MLEGILAWAIPRSPLFGVIGATIVLVSWVLTNTISNRLASAKAALDRVSADDDLRQRLDYLRRGYREIKSTLSRLDILLSEMNPKSNFSMFPSRMEESNRAIYSLLQTAETSFFEHEDLQEIIFTIKKFSAFRELPNNLQRDLKRAIVIAEELLQEYAQALAEWDIQRQHSIELIEQGDVRSDLFERATSSFIAAALPLHERFFEHYKRLLDLHDRVLEYFVNRLNRLKLAYSMSERLSWLLYTFGTSLAIFGKWLEIQ